MNPKLTLLFVLLSALSLSAQDFAPVGAKWHYTQRHAFSPLVDYFFIESVGDTVIHGTSCRILQENDPIFCSYQETRNYTYEQDSVVYFYEKSLDTFQTLYDIKAVVGDTWTTRFRETPSSPILNDILVRVDSVSSMIVNGHTLKTLFVSFYDNNSSQPNPIFSSVIIEKIGDGNHLFNLPSTIFPVCDGNYSMGLRCYEDPTFGFYSTGIAPSCDYVYTDIENIRPKNDYSIAVTPNPAANFIHIDASEMIQKYQIVDLQGKTLLSENVFNSQFDIDLQNIPNGIYILNVMQNDGYSVSKKIAVVK